MEEQSIPLMELMAFALFTGSVTFLLGLSYQLFVSIRADKGLTLRQCLLVILTRLLTIGATFIFWVNWNFEVDILFGPFLIPALAAEIVFSPLLLRLFGYPVWARRKAFA